MQPKDYIRMKALRDAVICIGWVKILSIVCYAVLWFLVHSNCEGKSCSVLYTMVVAVIPFQIVHGLLLFFGTLESKTLALELGIWMCFLLAAYNTALGCFGCVYFIRTGHLTMHFFLAVIFALIALSLLNVICHDIIVIFAYKQLLLEYGPLHLQQVVRV